MKILFELLDHYDYSDAEIFCFLILFVFLSKIMIIITSQSCMTCTLVWVEHLLRKLANQAYTRGTDGEKSYLCKTFDRSKKYFQTKKLEPIEVWRYSPANRSFKHRGLNPTFEHFWNEI